MPNPTIGLDPWGTALNDRLDEIASLVTGSAGFLYGGDAAYNISPSRTGVQNRTALLQLVADCQTTGKVGVIPAFRQSGAPKLCPLAPVQIILNGALGDVEIIGPLTSGFKQVVDPATSLAYKALTPASGFANDVNGATPGNQNYWVFVDRTSSNNSITWRGVTFEGGHGSNNSPSAPNNGEASWLQWGIGLRIPRRGRLYNTVHGGSWAGIQFDGDYDHTHCEAVDSAGNWNNVRFGPRQNEKDNIFINCSFANSSNAGIAVAPTGFLGGSSFFGGHLGTQPYGVYIESGAKSQGLAIQIQNMNWNEIIWEGCGNYKIFCEDGDTQLNNMRFHDAQWHGLEVGDHSNIHVRHCSVITNLARAATGIVTVTVAAVSWAPASGPSSGPLAGIAAGQYVVLNGRLSQPVHGVKVGGGALDTSLVGVYRVLTASGTTVTMQGVNTGVVASGAVVPGADGEAWLARVGAVRAGKLTGWFGNLQITGDEVDARDRANYTLGATWPAGGYGTAAELCFDIVNMQDCQMFDQTYLPNFGNRMAAHAGTQAPSFWRTSGGAYFLAKNAGALDAKMLVQFRASLSNGDVEAGTASQEPLGVVGGTSAATHPMTPAGVYLNSGEYCWVQDGGFAEVLGSGTSPQAGSIASVAGRAAISDTGGKVKVLASGTAPAGGPSGEFRAGKACGTLSTGTSQIKLGSV